MDLWTTHLDCMPYGPYESAFDGLPADEVTAHEEVRLGQIRDTLRRIDATVPVVLVGDFNSPSHLDRPDAEWPVTRAAEQAGLRDSYREAHPDPVRDPGHTWSPVHAEHEVGSGRPEPQDRIDFRPAPGADGPRLPDVRQRPPPALAGRRGQRLAVRPRGGDHHILAGQPGGAGLPSVP